LCITLRNATLVEGTLPYPVYLEEDDVLDWTLESFDEKKYILVTLFKAMPMPGMTIWWTRPLEEMKELISLEDHNHGSFQQAWKEAHEQFQERIQEKKKLNDRVLVQKEKFSVEELEEE
jgi:hypothetical protein